MFNKYISENIIRELMTKYNPDYVVVSFGENGKIEKIEISKPNKV